MKSYNGLFDKAIQDTEIEAALESAAKHKRRRRYVQAFYKNKDENLKCLKAKLENGTWKPPIHKLHLLQEGPHKKERTITKPSWNDEQIVHHILMRQFKPIILARLHKYSCGCIPYRGAHYLVKVMEHWRNEYKGNRFYVAELDVKKCYDTVDLSILKLKLSKIIRDSKYLDLLFKVLDNSSQSDGKGLPKGFYTSPWLIHFYYLRLDAFINQTIKPDHYARYVDNMWIFSTNKKKLHNAVRQISNYLQKECMQELNNKWQVFRFEQIKNGKVIGRPINLLGFIIHSNRITLRKSIIKRIRAKANRVRRTRKYTWRNCAALISYMGYFKHSNTHKYYLKWIKPKVSIRYAKSIIRRKSKNDRLENSSLSRKAI